MAKKRIAIQTLIEDARQLEKEGKNADALKIYRALTRRKHLNPEAFNRMMIILRKQKQYGAELEVIQRAIAAVEKAIASQRAINDQDPESAAWSRQLAESLGLLDEDGRPVYEEPQLRNWRKRESVVEKRLERLKNKGEG